jgi:hypothetical protein
MLKTLTITAALVLAGLGVSAANAKEGVPEGNGSVVNGAAAAPAKPTRYCVKGEITGSRIPRTECHSRADWLDMGFDPLEAMAHKK